MENIIELDIDKFKTDKSFKRKGYIIKAFYPTKTVDICVTYCTDEEYKALKGALDARTEATKYTCGYVYSIEPIAIHKVENLIKDALRYDQFDK